VTPSCSANTYEAKGSKASIATAGSAVRSEGLDASAAVGRDESRCDHGVGTVVDDAHAGNVEVAPRGDAAVPRSDRAALGTPFSTVRMVPARTATGSPKAKPDAEVASGAASEQAGGHRVDHRKS
jgi:hypothetical protein